MRNETQITLTAPTMLPTSSAAQITPATTKCLMPRAGRRIGVITGAPSAAVPEDGANGVADAAQMIGRRKVDGADGDGAAGWSHPKL